MPQNENPPPLAPAGDSEAMRPLPWSEKLGYSAGDFACCLYWGIVMNYLLFFYTDVFGITAAAAGAIIFITRTWDWINDPIMGVVADRTKSPMGKYRPWLLWMIIPFFLVGVIWLYTPPLDATGKFIYALIAYNLVMMVYTAVNIPYSSLMGVMTGRSEDRTQLASFRFVGAFAGTMLVNVSILYLVDFLGQGDKQLGFTLAGAVYGALAGVMFFITFKTSKERLQAPVQQKQTIGKDVGTLFKNVPWMMMIVLSILTILWIAVRGSATVYYFKYLSGDEKWAGWFLGFGSGAQIVGVLISKYIASWCGSKKNAFLVLNAIAGVFIAAFYFIDPKNLPLILVHQVISSFLAAPLMPLFWSMIADTADYGAWKLNHRSTGLLFSAGTLSQKIGWSIGPALAGVLITTLGYDATKEVTPDVIDGFHAMMSWIPAVFAMIAAAAVIFYPINGKVEAQMRAALATKSA